MQDISGTDRVSRQQIGFGLLLAARTRTLCRCTWTALVPSLPLLVLHVATFFHMPAATSVSPSKLPYPPSQHSSSSALLGKA